MILVWFKSIDLSGTKDENENWKVIDVGGTFKFFQCGKQEFIEYFLTMICDHF